MVNSDSVSIIEQLSIKLFHSNKPQPNELTAQVIRGSCKLKTLRVLLQEDYNCQVHLANKTMHMSAEFAISASEFQ